MQGRGAEGEETGGAGLDQGASPVECAGDRLGHDQADGLLHGRQVVTGATRLAGWGAKFGDGEGFLGEPGPGRDPVPADQTGAGKVFENLAGGPEFRVQTVAIAVTGGLRVVDEDDAGAAESGGRMAGLPVDEVRGEAFPRMLGLAELGWSPARARKRAGYSRRLAAQGPRLDAQDITYCRAAEVPWP
ncbi:hypothetical protein ACWFQ8_06770 [Streptomyces sp. NPDC055254]